MIVIKDVMKDHRVKEIHMSVNLHRLSIAKAEEEMGFEILRNDGRHYQPSGAAPHHRVVHCRREKNIKYSRNTQGECLLSLFFHGGGNLENYPFYSEDCENLKILDFEGFGLN